MAQGCVISKKLADVIPEKLVKDKIHVEASPMEPARTKMNNGDYSGALKEYNEIFKRYPKKSPGDKALFEMGILFAYPDNPKRSRSKASGYFKRLISDFPESPMRGEALAWSDTLDRISECERRIRALSDENDEYKKQVKDLEGKNMGYEEQIRAYEEQIKALKEIDIGLEEKKRQVPTE